MYCPNCGKELTVGGRFCPSCGQEITPAPAVPSSPVKAAATVTLNRRTLLVVAGVVIAAILALVLFVLPMLGSREQAPDQPSSGQSEPAPDPSEALVGTWSNKDGVGLKFGSDGVLYLSGLGLTLGGDTFSYEVTGENTLTLTATVGGLVSADLDAPYGIVGDTLYIELGGYEFELTKK